MSAVNIGVPQGLILGLLTFLIYINNLPEGLFSDVPLFADSTMLFQLLLIYKTLLLK